MKAIKIIIVVVVLGALGFGIWKMVTADKPDNNLGGLEIPDDKECQEVVNLVKKKCYRTYGSLQDGDFDGLQGCYDKVYNYFNKDESTRGCMLSVTLKLNSIHRERFVAMSNKEQGNKEWPNREKMEALCDVNMEMAGNSDRDLNRIKQGCTEYAALVDYNSRVQSQCGSRPSTMNSRWDMDNTRSLINGRPVAHDPADHTKPYEDSEKSKVQGDLFGAHVQFLKTFVKMADARIDEDASKNVWNVWSGVVRRELKVFAENAQQVYGKSSTEVGNKMQEVKNGLFDIHVKYLTKCVNNVKYKAKNAKKYSKWETDSKMARDELAAFVKDAQTNYGSRKVEEAKVKAKKAKNTLCQGHEGYLSSRIRNDSLIIIEHPKQYDFLRDTLYLEIEFFKTNAWNFYGQSVEDKAKKLKERVDDLDPFKKPEQPSTEP